MSNDSEIVRPEKLTLKNAQILWPNFAGAEKMYNTAGDRNFHILIEDNLLAEIMANAGWPVKEKSKRDPEDPEEQTAWHIQVKANYKGDYPPRIYKVTMDDEGVRPVKRLLLDASTVMLLDILKIQWADVTISPYIWTYQNRQGISAYVEVMYAVTEENPLDLEWDDRFAEGMFEDGPGPDDVDELM